MVTQGCRRLSTPLWRVYGLDHLLLAPEQHLHDAAVEREQRRSRRGLRHCGGCPRVPANGGPTAATDAARPERDQSHRDGLFSRRRRTGDHCRGHSAAGTSAGAARRWIDEKRSSSCWPTPASCRFRPPARRRGRRGRPSVVELPVSRAQTAFGASRRDRVSGAKSELAFLAKTPPNPRPAHGLFTAPEASDAAASVCNLGLECWPDHPGDIVS